MRIIGIDYGDKHIGTAVADTKTDVALKLRDIEIISPDHAVKAISALVQAEHAQGVVFGLPLTFAFDETPLCEVIRACAHAVGMQTGAHVDFINEILSSDLSKRMGQTGRKDHSGSAQILLQDYLDKTKEHGER